MLKFLEAVIQLKQKSNWKLEEFLTVANEFDDEEADVKQSLQNIFNFQDKI